ncbi:LPS export ABC transporter periplasmic protein LptC [Alteriqipengyuania flavescens]|uniref:LPS export ABC transporter periplasmic protein LptC n=1 Tax=Alteriqipengyuania flavescens TaxID=3053610 RepID=UPI0025B57D2B|nr:LPS export ABC transporter periplasmic protein LptC [Alteriqipengyuania flavescens]WJY19755.1 LPS export ABC transporter periplasmic protein LptC [Alteriqipengyuania flavescens]WJY25695.1 LPS export ABC transporter periplasmic protein LptC [Alteriqipengyuania flavescens]
MTAAADQMRNRRQRLAAPGGAHDRLVRILAVALPAAVGVVAALMVVTPLAPRGEISFLLDRNKVAIAPDRLAVRQAMYRGQDDNGRPFSVMAASAVQETSTDTTVEMGRLEARILLDAGPAILQATGAVYDFAKELISVGDTVEFEAADGYRMTARNVTVDIAEHTVIGSGGIEGAIPAGSFSANAIRADLDAREITLSGNARLRMVPGKLRMP